MKIAIVTGASSGMGRDFVLELDRCEHFDEIWVAARRAERLEALRNETKAPLRVFSLDLSCKEGTDALAQALSAEKPDIAVLVNAAGYGRFGEFDKISLDDTNGMIALNDRALVDVTYICLPYMKAGARIYELGSLSAFQPVPYMAIYAASKAFVMSFSRSLNAELKDRGIRCMAVCPGWVKTEFFDRAKTDDTISYYNRYYESIDVVRRAIRDMKRGKDVSVCGAQTRGQVFLVKLLPHRLVMKIWCRQQGK